MSQTALDERGEPATRDGGEPAATAAPLQELTPEEARRLDRHAERDLSSEVRLYALAGGVAFWLIHFLSGLPGVLNPLSLAFTTVMSLVFGCHAGRRIRLKRGGVLRGAMISAASFALCKVLLCVPDLLGGRDVLSVLLLAVVSGAVIGSVPGGMIGWHVERTCD